MNSKTITIFLVLTVTAGCHQSTEAPKPKKVLAEAAQAQKKRATITLSGTVKPASEEKIVAKYQATIKAVQARPGIRVRAGQSILSLKTAKGRTVILRASKPGLLRQILVEKNQRIKKGQALALVAHPGNYTVRFELPAQLQKAHKKNYLTLKTSLFRAANIRAPIVERGEGYITAAFKYQSGLLEYKRVKTTLSLRAAKTYKLPINALYAPTGEKVHLWVVRKNRVKEIAALPLKLADNRVSVLAPLQADDQVLLANHEQVLPGDQVEVIAKAEHLEAQR